MGDVQVQIPPNQSTLDAGTNAAAQSVVSIRQSTERQQAVFEFTKRKKWADLLVTELAGTVLLVLSSSGEILFVGSAALELLGWKDNEVIDTELANWLHEDDVAPFLAHFDNCVATSTEMATFSRLRASGEHRWPVFELRGHPHYDDGNRECKCFFVMARPYPSRNTAMLDSFLELKIENERLRQRLVDLRPSASSYPPPPYLNGQAVSNVRGGGSADVVLPTDNGLLNTGLVYNGANNVPIPALYRPHYFAGQPTLQTARVQNVGVSPEEISPVLDSRQTNQTLLAAGYSTNSNTRRQRDLEDVDAPPELSRKKKIRKTTGASNAPADENKTTAPQYVCVTCGRTDSPEWRKGPLGAKTLCNACGLRWAKRNSKKKAEVESGKEEGGDSEDKAKFEKSASVEMEAEASSEQA